METSIDYRLLFDIQPLPGDKSFRQEMIDTDSELEQINKELSEIVIDTIPFDQTDAIIIFASAMSEVAADFFLSDPTNPNSFASKCNDSNNPIGKWMNKIHEGIDHKNNPLDNQGAFNVHDKLFKHGEEKPIDGIISFGGGDHRERTYGHDLFHFWSAIMQYHDGQFRDGGYIDGVFREVHSTIGQHGTVYGKMGWRQSVIEYICHMFADFFSTKGLPCPGWSWLSHADDRELRQSVADLYKEGMNLRTEILKNITVAIPEIIIRVIQYIRYRKSEYSKEAKYKKIHLMLLITHGISAAVNVGKVIVSENPAALNLPMIMRTLNIALLCIKDNLEYKHLITQKINLDLHKQKLEFKKTVIITLQGVYYTAEYQKLTVVLEEEYKKRVQKRIKQALEISNMCFEYDIQRLVTNEILTNNSMEILNLSEYISTYDQTVSLKELKKIIPPYEGSINCALDLFKNN